MKTDEQTTTVSIFIFFLTKTGAGAKYPETVMVAGYTLTRKRINMIRKHTKTDGKGKLKVGITCHTILFFFEIDMPHIW